MAQVEDQEESRKVMYPLDPNSYQILNEIGRSVSSIVYKASCIAMDSSTVAIKVIDVDQSRSDLLSKTFTFFNHTNILNAHCCFPVENSIWVVMPFMHVGSVESMMGCAFLDGIPETCIAFVLKEILTALAYLHDQGQLHKEIKAGNILIDSNGSVKLADFGVCASIYESKSCHGSYVSSSYSSLKFTDSAVTPYWVAPEVEMSNSGYSKKADIWAFGITALELAYGRPPLSNISLSKSALDKLNNRFCFPVYDLGEGKTNKKFSEVFKDMVSICLDQDPSKRPPADKLLRHAFFKGCREDPEFLVKSLLQGFPNVEQRFFKEHDRSEKGDQEGSLEGENVEHRRIIGWNFNVEHFKMEPVFAVGKEEDGIVKQVRFGGEIIIQEEEQDGGSGENVDSSGNEIVAIGCGNGEGGSIKEVLVRGFLFLKKSLEDQKAKVMHIIALLGGGGGNDEMSREEELMQMNEQLRNELENEKMKNYELQIELQVLKLQLSNL